MAQKSQSTAWGSNSALPDFKYILFFFLLSVVLKGWPTNIWGFPEVSKVTTMFMLLLFSRYVLSISFATPWTAARQATLSMGFPRQKYWSGLPFLSPEDLSNPGIEPLSPALRQILYH